MCTNDRRSWTFLRAGTLAVWFAAMTLGTSGARAQEAVTSDGAGAAPSAHAAPTPSAPVKDWDVRLQVDARTLVILLNETPKLDSSTAAKHGDAVEEYASRVRTYPPEKARYLSDFADTYVDYFSSYVDDVLRAFGEAMEGEGEMNVVEAQRTRELEERMRRYHGTDYVVTEVQGIADALRTQMPAGVPPEEQAYLLSIVGTALHDDLSKIVATQKTIFGEST